MSSSGLEWNGNGFNGRLTLLCAEVLQNGLATAFLCCFCSCFHLAIINYDKNGASGSSSSSGSSNTRITGGNWLLFLFPFSVYLTPLTYPTLHSSCHALPCPSLVLKTSCLNLCSIWYMSCVRGMMDHGCVWIWDEVGARCIGREDRGRRGDERGGQVEMEARRRIERERERGREGERKRRRMTCDGKSPNSSFQPHPHIHNTQRLTYPPSFSLTSSDSSRVRYNDLHPSPLSLKNEHQSVGQGIPLR